jgi:hypothetical protein
MAWSQRMIEGFLLAAAIAEDAAGEIARVALAPAAAKAAARAAERLETLDAGVRRQELRRIAASLRPPPSEDAVLTARARAVLARDMPKEIGRMWLGTSPATRRGWSASRALRETVRRAACAARADDDPARETEEHGAGREALARAWTRASEDDRASLLHGLPADEASSVLALAQLLDGGALRSAGRSGTLDDVLVRTAASCSEGTRRIRVLGAMCLAASGDARALGRASSFYRAGREIAELLERA